MENNHPIQASTQALHNPDLLYTIFSLVPRTPGARHSPLVGCTTVCRTFYEPAIRVLWRNLETLVVLWHLLAPADVTYPFGYRYSGGKDSILLEYLEKINSGQLYLDPIRWERFLWHAAHVRRVFHFSTSPALCDATRLLIQGTIMQNGGNPILPLLRTLQWWTRVPIRDGTLSLLLTSTLRHVIICFGGDDEPAIVLLLRRLRESSPSLETLTIHMGPALDTLGLSPIRELVQFNRLREVVVSLIQDPSAFRAIVTKPNLTCIDAVVRRGATGSWLGLGRAVSVRDLRELTVSGDASVVSEILKPLRFQALERAVVQLNSSTGSWMTPSDITAFLSLFYNTVSGSDFKGLELRVYINTRNFRPVGHNDPALRTLLAPMFPIRGLRSFRLVTGQDCMFVGLDDADICALAAAWPRLERLSIDRGFTSESSLSMHGVHNLYVNCTELRELSIPRLRWPLIGVHSIPAPLDNVPAHLLRYLSMQDSGPDLSNEAAEAMARYLLDLFPSLDPRRHKPPMGYPDYFLPPIAPSDQDSGWSRVVGYICSIRSARRWGL